MRLSAGASVNILLTVMLVGAVSGCKKGESVKAPAVVAGNARDGSGAQRVREGLVPNLSLPILKSRAIWELAPLLGQKTVLLAFFTTWCPYCKKSMPYLQSFYEKNMSRNFELVAIGLGEPEEKAAGFVKEFGLTFPVLLAQDQSAIEANYPVRFLPTLYLINRQGTQVRKFEGFHPSVLDEVAQQL